MCYTEFVDMCYTEFVDMCYTEFYPNKMKNVARIEKSFIYTFI